MIHELVYTSVPEGLKPGSQGFCTVAHTMGIPSNLAMRLETFSAYRHLFQPPSSKVSRNPVMAMHLTLNLGVKRYHVLSRVADAGLDYTQRTNKIAHHFLFEDTDCPTIGPAALFSIPNLFLTEWKRRPGLLPVRAAFPAVDVPPLSGAWERLGGDRGWANAVAETVLTERPVSILFEPGTDVLPLFVEAIARLPVEYRRQVTFSSYYNKLPPGVACQWKGIVLGSPEAQTAAAADALVIDLSRPLGKAPPVTRTFETRKPPSPPPTTPAATQEVQVESDESGIYELSEPLESVERTATPFVVDRKAVVSPPWSSPTVLVVLLILAFLLGAAVGVGGTWWMNPPPPPPPPQNNFLLDCIDLLFPR